MMPAPASAEVGRAARAVVTAEEGVSFITAPGSRASPKSDAAYWLVEVYTVNHGFGKDFSVAKS
jgi:hypothetical protein